MDSRFRDITVTMDTRFTEVHEAILTMADLMVTKDYLEERLQKLQTTMVTKEYLKDYIDHRLGQFETRMVTKDYLDQKIGSLRGDLVVMTRRPDQKVDTLLGVLHKKHLITDTDVQRVNSASR
ncbi:MAG: hypothetical protein WCV85_02110 [Patescibacteria group bacterium]